MEQEALALRWAYLVDARGVLSLFDRDALANWNEGRTLRYCGTRQFGSVTADYIVMDLPENTGPYKRIHLWIAQGEHPVPLMLVRDGDRSYIWSPADEREDSLTRQLDTEWRFTNWRLNEPMDARSFRLTMRRPVGRFFRNVQTAMKVTEIPLFMGSPLPEFTAINADRNTLDRDTLLNGKHTVLLVWHDKNSFLRNLKAAEAAEAKYGSDAVQTIGLYVGVDAKKQQASELLQSFLNPDMIANAGLRVRPWLYRVTKNRTLLQGRRDVLGERCAVIDPSGVIIDTLPSYVGFDFASMVVTSIGASLESRDVVQERRESLRQLEVSQQESIKFWNERFKTSWDD